MIARGELGITNYDDITELAATALILKNKGPIKNTSEILSIGLDYVLPQIWINEQSPVETAETIFKLCQQMSQERTSQLISNYVNICKTAHGYGVWFYPVTEVKSYSEQQGEVVSPLDYVGVSHKGLHLFDVTRTETVQLFPFSSIVEYGADNDIVWFQFKTPKGNNGPQAEFSTKVPWEIYSLIQSYFDLNKAKGENRPKTTFNRYSVFRSGN